MERHLLVNAKPLHGLSIAGLKRREIAELLSTIRENHSDSTANHVRAALSGFFTWAMKEGLLRDEAANR
jgi:site-specific recombinase XerD